MSNFEKITATPEALGAFLDSLTVIDSPWERDFQKTFCAECRRDDCDVKGCQHQDKRNNPLWWLMQEEKRSKAESLLIRIMKIHDDYRELLGL